MQQGARSVHLRSADVDPEQTVEIPINFVGDLALDRGLGGIQLVIAYDSSVVQLTSGDVSQGERTPTLFVTDVIAGQINILAAWIDGSGPGDFLLATLSVTAVGLPGTQTSLTLTIGAVYDPDIAAIAGVQAGSGRIRIRGEAPVAADDSYIVDEGGTVNVGADEGLLANDSDPDDDTLTAVRTAGPSNGTLFLTRRGLLTYIHNGSETTGDSFTYVANDGFLDSNTATVTITVIPVNDPPLAINDSYVVPEAGILVVDTGSGILANDFDAENTQLAAALVGEPSNGTLSFSSSGSFDYFPAVGFKGTDSFTYRSNDGELNSNTATVTITVAPGGVPVTMNDSYIVDEGGTITVGAEEGLLANDSDPDDDPLTAVQVTGPSNGFLISSPNGSFIYLHDGSETIRDSFTYVASDGFFESDPATVTINVIPINDPPVAANDSYVFNAGDTFQVPAPGVLANDIDAENRPLAPVLLGQPSKGTLALDFDGSFDYLPDINFEGSDSFTYQATDGELLSNTATVTITVVAAEIPEVSSEATIGVFGMLASDQEEPVQPGDRFDMFVAITTPTTGAASSLQFSVEFDEQLFEFVPPVELSEKFSGCESAFNGRESGKVNVALACGSVHNGDLRVLLFTLRAKGVQDGVLTSVTVESAGIFDAGGELVPIDM